MNLPRMQLSLTEALPGAFRKLDPRELVSTPVMLVVEIGAVATTVLSIIDPSTLGWMVTVWLWLTVLFGTLAESVAEGRGKAQAASLRALQEETTARRVRGSSDQLRFTGNLAELPTDDVPSTSLRAGDVVIVEAGERIPGDGDVIEGVASVDESAVTGESAPVIRESGGDRSAVTGGTVVLSDRIVIRITSEPGQSFVDRMIALVEGSERQRTPNEIALNVLLASLTAIFVVVCATLWFFADYSGARQSLIILTALLVCLIPTTIGALLSAIGIAGMDRLVQRNVLAMSGRAVEAAGDVDVLLLDKTGTVTFGNRQATELLPLTGVTHDEMAEASLLASLADETPEGRSIVDLVGSDSARSLATPPGRVHRYDPDEWHRPRRWIDPQGGRLGGRQVGPQHRDAGGQCGVHRLDAIVERVSSTGGTPLVVAAQKGSAPGTGARRHPSQGRRQGGHARAVRRDASDGHPDRDDHRRQRDHRQAIAAEAGVDDVLAEATPEDKMALIRKEQQGGRMVAMCGDGTNDAPALAQADVGVAMNTGTSAAKEAGNMVDLDSDPTKLIDVVEIGKQLLITRGALTTFSVANDVAKYFAILPAMFVVAFPDLDVLNIMQLSSPESAIVSAVVFNALVIVALIPLALRGVNYRPSSASDLLRRNLLIYGVGGLVTPFVGIKLLDLVISLIPGL